MNTKAYTLGFAVSEFGDGIIRADIEQVLEGLGLKHASVKPQDVIRGILPKLVGKPYVKGASVSKDAPESFDCSSFVSYVYVQAGFALPRVSVDQFACTTRMDASELQFGDLVFSNTGVGKIYYETFEYKPGTPVPSGVDHVGMYVGEGEVIHATELVGRVVQEKLVESPRFTNIVGYGRVVGDLTERRFVVQIPEDRTDLRKSGVLLELLREKLRK